MKIVEEGDPNDCAAAAANAAAEAAKFIIRGSEDVVALVQRNADHMSDCRRSFSLAGVVV